MQCSSVFQVVRVAVLVGERGAQVSLVCIRSVVTLLSCQKNNLEKPKSFIGERWENYQFPRNRMRTSVERCCELAIKTTEQVYEVVTSEKIV